MQLKQGNLHMLFINSLPTWPTCYSQATFWLLSSFFHRSSTTNNYDDRLVNFWQPNRAILAFHIWLLFDHRNTCGHANWVYVLAWWICFLCSFLFFDYVASCFLSYICSNLNSCSLALVTLNSTTKQSRHVLL